MKNIKSFIDYLTENKNTTTEILSLILDNRNIEYKYITYFNKGSYGVLFDIGNNKLLKITNHKEEAETASWIKENEVPNIAKIYDVFKVESSEYIFPKELSLRFPYWKDSYFLIIEKVDTTIKDKIDEFYLILTKNFTINSQKNTLLSILEKEKVRVFFIRNFPEQIALYDNIYYLLSGLYLRYGLKYYDAHSGNIGTNQYGNLILFDVYDKHKKGIVETIRL